MEGYSMLNYKLLTTATMSVVLTFPATQPQSIDTQASVVTVHVSRAGALSAFGHDHQISAPITSAKIDTNARTVELHFNAAALRVSDSGASEKDRAEIQKTM